MTAVLEKLADYYKQPGVWCTVLADVGTGTVDSLESTDVRPAQIKDALQEAGAPKEDARVAEEAIQPVPGEPNPVARFVLIRDGHTEANIILHGTRVESPLIRVGPFPELLPLLELQPDDITFLTASVDRSGADIALHVASPHPAEDGLEISTTTEGTKENLKKVPGGGWSQGRYQHRTEEVWRRNADEVAAEIDRLVQQHHPVLIVLGGDLRARNLVAEQLSEQSRNLVAEVETHTRAHGADPDQLREAAVELLAAHQAREIQDALDKLFEELGRANDGGEARAVQGTKAVVQALQQAQVDTLFLSSELTAAGAVAEGATSVDDPARRHGLLALGTTPWIAVSEKDALNAPVVERVKAGEALLRAAALTEAKVQILPPAALPDQVHVAALLRWKA